VNGRDTTRGDLSNRLTRTATVIVKLTMCSSGWCVLMADILSYLSSISTGRFRKITWVNGGQQGACNAQLAPLRP
jgi:hypothetical protein